MSLSFGGSSQRGSFNQQGTSTYTPAPYIEEAQKNLLGLAGQAVSPFLNNPLQRTPAAGFNDTLGAARLAGTNALGVPEFMSFGTSQALQGFEAPQAQATSASAGQITGSGIRELMSPYLQDVVDTTRADMEASNAAQLNALRARGAAAGAFGGSRFGVAEGQAIGDQSRALGSTLANLRHTGWMNAGQLAGQNAAMQTQANLSSAAAQNAMALANQRAAFDAAGLRLGAETQFNNANLAKANSFLNAGSLLGNLGQIQQQTEQNQIVSQMPYNIGDALGILSAPLSGGLGQTASTTTENTTGTSTSRGKQSGFGFKLL